MFLFFSSSSYHRHLHSFPTRRSSDLIHHAMHAHCNWDCSVAMLPIQSVVSACGASAWDRGLQLSLSSDQVSIERSEEHTSELQSVAISYAVFCLKKKKPEYRPS